MDLAQQFGAVKLKKAAVGTHDRSAPVVAGQEHDAAASVEQFKNKIHAVNLENWYPLLKEHTFATEFLDLSMLEARALVRQFDRQRGKHAHEQESDDDARLLSELERKIDELVGPFKNDGGAFVRLSTRSPKDAVVNSKATLDEWQRELAKLGPEAETDENVRLVALIKASTAGLKVHSGFEALALVKASERSNEDLLLALEFPQQWDMKIIIRRWARLPISSCPVEMDPAMEFRGFVCRKKLTALSQYFHIVYFPELAARKAEIGKRIEEYFAQHIVDLIPLDNYIIDFGIASSAADDDAVLVIELNPFNDYVGCGTDPGLFNWRTDRQVVEGDAPFEFRVREAAFDVKPHIILQWRELIAVPP